MKAVSFVDANNRFSCLVLSTYRKIEENVLGYKPSVYRESFAGGNAGVVVSNGKWETPIEYEKLKNIPFITSLVIDQPFISYPKKNTRNGFLRKQRRIL